MNLPGNRKVLGDWKRKRGRKFEEEDGVEREIYTEREREREREREWERQREREWERDRKRKKGIEIKTDTKS